MNKAETVQVMRDRFSMTRDYAEEVYNFHRAEGDWVSGEALITFLDNNAE